MVFGALTSGEAYSSSCTIEGTGGSFSGVLVDSR